MHLAFQTLLGNSQRTLLLLPATPDGMALAKTSTNPAIPNRISAVVPVIAVEPGSTL